MEDLEAMEVIMEAVEEDMHLMEVIMEVVEADMEKEGKEEAMAEAVEVMEKVEMVVI
mgnify:FL=1